MQFPLLQETLLRNSIKAKVEKSFHLNPSTHLRNSFIFELYAYNFHISLAKMKLRITWQYVVAFFALNMIMGELHEQVHITTGYLICGCYGPRDISSWNTCEECTHASWAFLATALGPLFSYSLMWLGVWLFTRSKNVSKRSFGFSLLFANLPFARIFTALVGGGDEKVFIHHLLGESTPIIFAKVIAAIIVLLICLPPIIIIGKKITNSRRWLIITGFLVIPLMYGILYQRMFINQLLKQGIGADTFLLGTPNIILLHFAFMLVLLFLFYKRLLNCFTNQNIGLNNQRDQVLTESLTV